MNTVLNLDILILTAIVAVCVLANETDLVIESLTLSASSVILLPPKKAATNPSLISTDIN